LPPKAFFRSAKTVTGVTPERVTTDGHDSYPRAIRTTLGGSLSVHLQPKSRHQRRHLRHRLPGIAGSAADDEIIGIVDDVGVELVPVAMVVPGQQETPKVEVAAFTCFAGLKPSLRDAAISMVSPVPGLRP
jgi:hypothetical protein